MIRCLVLMLLTAAALHAQRHEFSLQFGTTLTQRRSIAVPAAAQNVLGTDVLRENNGYAGGIVYRVRLVSFGPAALLAEVPVFVVQATETELIPVIARPVFGNTSGISGFLTPGAAVRFLPEARVSPYAFFGAGYARILELELTSVSPVRGGFANEGTWAIDYGGGVDLSLAKVIAIRAELRNFYTGRHEIAIPLPEEIRQRNTLLLTAGVVFRF